MSESLVKKYAEQIKQEIDKASAILLHCHPSPDPDSVGTALAMFHLLTALGKRVTVIAGDSEKPTNLDILPGFDEIKQQTYGETNLSDFDLFIVLDSGGLDQISRLEKVEFPDHLMTIVIDHHPTNPGYGKLNLIDPTYPATAELVYDLISELNLTVTPEVAICLFVGIYYDTGGFRFRSTTSRTFAIASRLVEMCPNFSQVISHISDQLEVNHLYLQAEALKRIETIGNGQVAMIALPYEVLEKFPISETGAKNHSLPHTLISVKGWNIGVSVVEKEPGFNRVSFRSKEKPGFDVSKVAESLGGGGHKLAAGAMVKGGNLEAKNIIARAILDIYPELK